MKNRILGLAIFFAALNPSLRAQEISTETRVASAGLRFLVPPTLKERADRAKASPVLLAFTFGEEPLTSTVLFKEISATQDLESWIAAEHESWKEGDYEAEMNESRSEIGGQAAINLKRKSAVGEIHMTVFRSPKDGKLYGFWHMTSESTDPQQVALKAMKSMLASLEFDEAAKAEEKKEKAPEKGGEGDQH